MKKIVYGVIVALCGLFIAPDVEAQAGMAGSAKETVAVENHRLCPFSTPGFSPRRFVENCPG